MEKDDFECGADQYARMNDNHPFEVRFRNALGPLGQHEFLMAAGNSQFYEAEHSYSREESEIKIDAQAH